MEYVGDSFAVVVSGPKTIALSTDHACYTNDSELARVFTAGGYVDPSQSYRIMGFFMPSRSIGDIDFKLSSPAYRESMTAIPELEYILAIETATLDTGGGALCRCSCLPGPGTKTSKSGTVSIMRRLGGIGSQDGTGVDGVYSTVVLLQITFVDL